MVTVAMIQKYGVMDNLQLEGKWIDEACDLVKGGDGKVSLAFTADPQGEYINITCLFGDKQREEWSKMGLKVGEA